MRHVHNRKMFCADLETTTANTIEYNKYHRTTFYACSIAPIPVMFDTNEGWHSVKYLRNLKSRYALRHFGLLEDFWDYLNQPKTWGDNLVVFFHNGQHFDFYFLIEGLKEHPATFHETLNENDLGYHKLMELYTGYNFGTYENGNGGLSLRVWLGNEKTEKHIAIEFLDTRKLSARSIEAWDKDLLHKTFLNEYMADEGTEGGTLGIHKDHKIDFDYVQYIDGETAYCKDGTSYNLRDSKHGPQAILDRVGNDVLIMVYTLKYMFIHGMINLPTSNKIYKTMSAVAIARYIYFRLRNDPVFDKMVRDEKGDVDKNKVGTSIYGLSLESRVSEVYQFYNGIHGGLTTFHPCAYNTLREGKYLSLDINSLYPGNATFPLPYGEPVKMDKVDLSPNNICFVHIKFKGLEQKNRHIPPVIPKAWGRDAEKLSNNKEQHYTYRLLEGEAYLITNADYETFTNPRDFTFKKMEVVDVIGFQTSKGCKDFMEYWSNVKQTSKSESERGLAKQLMNSFTGKLDQRSDRDVSVNPKYGVEHYLTMDDMINKYCKDKNPLGEINKERIEGNGNKLVITGGDLLLKNYEPADFTFPCAYAYITARGRGYIIKRMCDLTSEGPSLINVYTDTDSMKLWCTDPNDYEPILKGLKDNGGLDDKKLGLFKEEDKGEVYGMKVLAAKKYVAVDKEGFIIPSKSGLSGINFKDLCAKYGTDKLTADKINPGDEITTKRTRHVKGGVLIEDTNLILSNIKTEELENE